MEYHKNEHMEQISREWIKNTIPIKYPYRFDWKGVSILQYPHDMIGLCDIIHKSEPSVVIETGVAHGGLTFFINDVFGLDVIAIEQSFLKSTREILDKNYQITLIEGNSVSKRVINRITNSLYNEDEVMVILDSNHTHDHVLKELHLYSEFVSRGCYLVVMDTIIEFMPNEYWKDKPYGVGNSPYTAVQEFLRMNDRFELDENVENKLGITCAPGGWLKCVK